MIALTSKEASSWVTSYLKDKGFTCTNLSSWQSEYYMNANKVGIYVQYTPEVIAISVLKSPESKETSISFYLHEMVRIKSMLDVLIHVIK
jgi:hypothetical protein